MKAVPLALRGVLAGLLTSTLPAQTLVTPGTATWSTEITATGERTVFTITGNTVLDWAQLNLGKGSELVFDFVGGDSVVNNLTGTSTHHIDGSVSGNGLIGFFSPNARIEVGGDIVADSVTIATLGVDAVDFADGGGYIMTSSGAIPSLRISGSIQATSGDVALAGLDIEIRDSATITANQGSVLFGAAGKVSVAEDGGRRLRIEGTLGFLDHSGSTSGDRIEAAAVDSIVNRGTLNAGSSKIFLEVGSETGNISNELNGIIVGDASFDGSLLDEGVVILPHSDDAPPAVSEGRLKVPTLKRPNGSKITTRKTVSYSSPMSASSDAGRTAKRKDERVAKVDSSKSLLRRDSFFGARGSRTVASR